MCNPSWASSGRRRFFQCIVLPCFDWVGGKGSGVEMASILISDLSLSFFSLLSSLFFPFFSTTFSIFYFLFASPLTTSNPSSSPFHLLTHFDTANCLSPNITHCFPSLGFLSSPLTEPLSPNVPINLLQPFCTPAASPARPPPALLYLPPPLIDTKKCLTPCTVYCPDHFESPKSVSFHPHQFVLPTL